jgi:hypothetical protein
VLRCEYVDGTKGGQYAAKVNQLVFDEGEQKLEFRVAETVGTKNPITYLFSNAGDDSVVLQRTGASLSAGGVRFGAPFAIKVNEDTGVVVWQYVDGELPEFSRYKCGP